MSEALTTLGRESATGTTDLGGVEAEPTAVEGMCSSGAATDSLTCEAGRQGESFSTTSTSTSTTGTLVDEDGRIAGVEVVWDEEDMTL